MFLLNAVQKSYKREDSQNVAIWDSSHQILPVTDISAGHPRELMSESLGLERLLAVRQHWCVFQCQVPWVPLVDAASPGTISTLLSGDNIPVYTR